MTASDYPGSSSPPGSLTDADRDPLTGTGSLSHSGRDSMGGSGRGTPGSAEQARSTAGTAAEEGKHVAGVAKGEAQQVAAEARAQAQNVLSEAMTQIQDQSRTQRDRLVDTLRTFGDDLEQMASQGGRSGMATDLARQVAGRTRDLSTRLDGREPSDLLEDVRDFARRKPGMFLLGAIAAGVVAGRATRGAKAATSNDGSDSTAPAGGSLGLYDSVYDDPAATPGGTATGAPLATTDYPPRTAAPGPVSAEGGTTYSSEPGAEPWIEDPSRRGPL